jgi:DNA modification methylase
MMKGMEQMSKEWKELIRAYKRKNAPISFDFKNKVIKTLGKTNPSIYPHYIHYYPGKIFPYIPLFFFSSEQFCARDSLVLDPFSGSGTVLLESIINANFKRDAIGVEINPLGRLISKVKTTPLDVKSAKGMLRIIIDSYNSQPKSALFSNHGFKSSSVWFSMKAIERLSKLRWSIEKLDAGQDYKDFFWVCFSSIVRKVSRADPFIPPPVILKPYKYKDSLDKYAFVKDFYRDSEDPDVLSIFNAAVEANLKTLAVLNDIEEVREKTVKAKIIWDDARQIRKGELTEKGRIPKTSNFPWLAGNSVDFIVTSPPYLTAQKYIRTHKLELLWLGLLKEEELLPLDKELIGTEHVPVSDINFDKLIGVKSIDSLIKWAERRSRERAALVYKYFENMGKAMQEMHRVLRPDAYAVIVIGNNTVLKKKVNTYNLLTDLSSSIGFKEVLVLKDDIKGRGMITRRHNSGGLIKDEYIIVLKKETL